MLFAGIMATVMTVIYSQVQLTELTEEINQTSQALAEAGEPGDPAEHGRRPEDDAAPKWRSTPPAWAWKRSAGSQVTYINVAQEDQGTVVQQVEEPSLLGRLWNTVRSWFA